MSVRSLVDMMPPSASYTNHHRLPNPDRALNFNLTLLWLDRVLFCAKSNPSLIWFLWSPSSFLFFLTMSCCSKMDLLPDVWRQDYWLPPSVTWEDMEQLADSGRPQPRDLLVTLPLALGFVALRYVFERYSTSDLFIYCGFTGRLSPCCSQVLEVSKRQGTRRP